MMKEEEGTPPTSLQNGVVNFGFSSSEDDGKNERTTSGAVKGGAVSEANGYTSCSPEDSQDCGWLCLRPHFLQRFKTGKWVLFCLCWAAAVQGIVINGFVNVCITTIEKRYHMKSTSTGLIAGCYDMGAVLCSIPVSYLGSLPGASKPRWLGWGLLIMGLGSFTFALPHFMAPPYHHSLTNQDSTVDVLLCLRNSSISSSCEEKSGEWLSRFQYVFLLGQFLHGMGASPIYILGITYLDESVPLKMSSFYIGIFQAMAVVGPAIGFVLGGQFLSTYIDAPSFDPADFGILQGSDQWLGAWWIGFIVSGCLACIISWVVMSFPAQIPGAKIREDERVNASSELTSQAFYRLRDLPKAAKVLFTNLSFVFIALAEACEGIIMSGLATFMPKVIESQFSLSAGYSSILVGVLAVPAGGGGTFLGGWLVKRFNLKCEDVLKLCYIFCFATFICCISFVISCPNVPFAGVNESYDNVSLLTSIDLQSSCNDDCHCENVAFDPICGANELLYYSPCHAGCKTQTTIEGLQIYSDCECIIDFPKDSENSFLLPEISKPIPIPQDSGIRQKCPSKCYFLEAFLAIFFLVMLLTFIITMPSVTGTLRCVPDTYRSFGLGMRGIIIRILGTIPGPIIFGYILDTTCVLWQETCDKTGSCRSYNNSQMSKSLMAACLIFKAGSTISYFCAWFFFKRRKSALEIQKNDSVKYLNHSSS